MVSKMAGRKLKPLWVTLLFLLGWGLLLLLAGCKTLCVSCIGISCNVLPPSNITYRWEEWTIRQGNLQIAYPHLNGMKDKTAQAKINQALQTQLEPLYHYQQATIRWEETTQTGPYSSILLSGSVNPAGDSSSPFTLGIILDLQTGKILTPKEIFKSDPESLSKMASLIREGETDNDLSKTRFTSFPDGIGCYLSGDSFIFYFHPSDSPQEYASVRVPISKTSPYLQIKIK